MSIPSEIKKQRLEEKLSFDDLDYDSAYLMLKWLNSTELLKYERVSKTVQLICERHQLRQKVIYIKYGEMDDFNFQFNQDSYKYLCNDRSHDPVTPLVVKDLESVPKVMSKYINLKALYLVNDSEDNLIKEIKTFPTNLKHLYLRDKLKNPEGLNHLIDLLSHVDIEHLVLSNLRISHLTVDQLTSLFMSCPHIKMLYTFNYTDLAFKILPQLIDYTFYDKIIQFTPIKHPQQDKLNRLIRTTMPKYSQGILIIREPIPNLREVIKIISTMKNLKQLTATSLVYPFMKPCPRFDHDVYLEFNSPSELLKGNYIIKKLHFRDPLKYYHIDHISIDQLPAIDWVEFTYLLGDSNNGLTAFVDFMFKLKGVRIIKGNFSSQLWKEYIEIVCRRDSCPKYFIINLDEVKGNLLFDRFASESINLLNSLVVNHPSTRFVFNCPDQFFPETFKSIYSNLIINRGNERIFY